jgi:hypothetical protein
VAFVPSDVPVGQTSNHLILTSSNSVSSNASFLGIATYTRVSSVLILLKGGFTYLVMLSSMRQFTPSANLILMQVLIFNLKFFFYRLIPHLVFCRCEFMDDSVANLHANLVATNPLCSNAASEKKI